MKICINNEPIDFSLENEKNLGEIFDGVSDWLNKVGFIVSGFSADGKVLMISGDATWRATPLEDITRIDLNAELPADLRLRHFSILEQFFTLLGTAIRDSKDQDVADLVRELPGVMETMEILVGNDPGGTAFSTLARFLDESNLISNGCIDPDIRERCLEILDAVGRLLSERMEEIKYPEDQSSRTVAFLMSLIPDLNNVSVLLQTGRDREAMKTVVCFTEASQKLLRIFTGMADSRLSGGNGSFSSELAGFFSDFNGILHELLEAFEAGDSVLIGDLLEYEITPRLEKLPAFIKETAEEGSRT